MSDYRDAYGFLQDEEGEDLSHLLDLDPFTARDYRRVAEGFDDDWPAFAEASARQAPKLRRKGLPRRSNGEGGLTDY